MDATCAIQNSIHVFSLVHINMCPGFWVHITIPIGRCLYLILNFPHMSRVGIMHSQLHNYLHCLKCNLFICLSTHYAGLALISTKKSFQQFRIHSSPKHVQRIKTRKKAFEHCVFFICNIQSFLLFLKVHDTPLI